MTLYYRVADRGQVSRCWTLWSVPFISLHDLWPVDPVRSVWSHLNHIFFSDWSLAAGRVTLGGEEKGWADTARCRQQQLLQPDARVQYRGSTSDKTRRTDRPIGLPRLSSTDNSLSSRKTGKSPRWRPGWLRGDIFVDGDWLRKLESASVSNESGFGRCSAHSVSLSSD